MSKEYYSTVEAANIFKVSRKTVFQWVRSGKIKAIRVGRNYVIPHETILETLGKTIGTEKKASIGKAIDKAMRDYGEVFKRLGRE